jgi:transposase
MPGIAQEVKVEILAKVKAGEAVVKLSREYGVSDKTIYNWLRAGVENSASALQLAKVKKENDQLKQIIGILTLELEKSKKKSR